MLFNKNVGPYLSIDEVTLSKGELYTVVTNKNARGRRGTIVASIKGTRSEDIIKVLDNLKKKEKDQIIEVTMDMAKNMEISIKTSLPKAYIIADRFHVVKTINRSLTAH
jgi:transposase